MYKVAFDYSVRWTITKGSKKGQQQTKTIKNLTAELQGDIKAQVKRLAKEHFAQLDKKKKRIPLNARVFKVSFSKEEIQEPAPKVYSVTVKAQVSDKQYTFKRGNVEVRESDDRLLNKLQMRKSRNSRTARKSQSARSQRCQLLSTSSVMQKTNVMKRLHLESMRYL